jgi:alpha-amylase/alpha-mannosidase (GH57 family)
LLISFEKNKKNVENHKERSEQDMSKRPRFDFQSRTEEMENLTLGRTERRLLTTRTANASFPTWGQIKKLCNEGQNVVTHLG